MKKFAAVCVLDEVGLAEDSPKMPLKALHPLLEDGRVDDEPPEPHQKVKCCIHRVVTLLLVCSVADPDPH